MRTTRNQGLTLTELVIGIVVVAILASFFLPTFGTVTEKARIAKVTSNMKQVVLACRVFASDWDGHLPNSNLDISGNGASPLTTSGDAWKQLYDTSTLRAPLYWTAKARDCSRSQPVLEEGGSIDESMNYFAYVEGLRSDPNNFDRPTTTTDSDSGSSSILDRDDERLPIAWEVGDGNGVRYWTRREDHPWEKAFVVGYLDGSARAIGIHPKSGVPSGLEGAEFTNVVGTLGGGTNPSGGAEYRKEHRQLNP